METILEHLTHARDCLAQASAVQCLASVKRFYLEAAWCDLRRALSAANRLGNRRAQSACMRILNFIRADLRALTGRA